MSGHKGQVVDYVRVSAADQNGARQLNALGGVDRLFSDNASGRNVDDRAQLNERITYVREGRRRPGEVSRPAVALDDRPARAHQGTAG